MRNRKGMVYLEGMQDHWSHKRSSSTTQLIGTSNNVYFLACYFLQLLKWMLITASYFVEMSSRSIPVTIEL